MIERVEGSGNDERVTVRVLRGGELRKNKGVNLPDTEVKGSVLSDKDRADLEVAKREHVEVVAVSFVQRPSDVEEVRGILGPTAQIIAKIERPQALERIDDICRVSDGSWLHAVTSESSSRSKWCRPPSTRLRAPRCATA